MAYKDYNKQHVFPYANRQLVVDALCKHASYIAEQPVLIRVRFWNHGHNYEKKAIIYRLAVARAVSGEPANDNSCA